MKTYALEHSYEVSANRELVALGTANTIGVSTKYYLKIICSYLIFIVIFWSVSIIWFSFSF